MKRLTSWCTFLALWMVLAASAAAQSSDTQNQPAIDSGATVTGVGYAKQGQWTQLRNIVRNPTSQDVTVTIVNTLGKTANVQFGSTIWLPANSRRTVDLPARVSDTERIEPRKGMPLQSMLLAQSVGGREKSWLSRQTGQALVEGNSLNISMLGDSDDQIFELASLVRETVENEKGVRTIRSQMAPLTVEAWQPLSAVVIFNTPELDARQMDALRGWMLGGGRVWIMLENVDPAFVSELLGDLWDVAVVDDVRMSRITFGKTKQAGDVYDKPVTLVRTLPGSANVLTRVGRWPASMSITAGKGEVVVTTLSAQAWRTKQAKAPLELIGEHLLVRQGRQDSLGDAANDLAATRIGRPIVSRTVVMTILLIMIVLMIAGGIIFYRMDKLEWMGAAAPALAVVVALILLGIGKARQGEVPLTISTVSVMHVSPQLRQGVSTGSMAVYSPSMEQGPLQATTGGVVWPDLSGLQGRVVRFLVTDLGKWKWQGVEFSSGVIRTGLLEQSVQFDQSMSLQGRFGPRGLELNADLGPLSAMHDMLLATPGGVMSLEELKEDESQGVGAKGDLRRFVAGPGNVLAAGRFVRASAMLSEEQQQRQAFYAQVFGTPSALPKQPSLIGWAMNMSSGLRLEDGFDERSATLMVIPIVLHSPVVGAEVMVPSTFMSFDVVKVPGENTSATVYNRATGEWIAVTNPTRMALAFKLPESVLPVTIDRAKFTMAIRAPGRTVALFTREGLKGEPAYSVNGPTGEVAFEFDKDHPVKTDAQGRVLVIVTVGDHSDLNNPPLWKISGVKLEVQGKAAAAKGKARQTGGPG